MPVGPSYVDGTRPSSVISCRSPVEVDTGIGRVCGVSASSEPSRCTRRTFGRAQRRGEQGGELAPAQVRLQAEDQEQVAAVRQLGHLELGGRPADLALVVVVQLDPRPVDLEVVEVVRVEGEHRLGAVRLLQVLDGPGRGAAGVVPAAEGRDHHRVDQIAQVAHASRLADQASSTVADMPLTVVRAVSAVIGSTAVATWW